MKTIGDLIVAALVAMLTVLAAVASVNANAANAGNKLPDQMVPGPGSLVLPNAADQTRPAPLAGAGKSPTAFRVFNAMLYQQMPSFGERMAVVYEQSFFPGKRQRDDRTPLDEGILAAARQAQAMSGPPTTPGRDRLVGGVIVRSGIRMLSGGRHCSNSLA